MLGSIYLDQGETEPAKAAFEKALSLDARHVPTLSYYGFVLASKSVLNEPVKGKEMLQRAVALEDSSAAAHYYLGLILADQGEYSAARVEIELAAVLDPENAEIAAALTAIRHIVKE